MDFLTKWWMYLLGVFVMVFVISQSVFFLVKSSKRAKEIGISTQQIKKTITSSMVFSVAPAIAILFGVVSLKTSLGVVIPWIRLSVLGALTYEVPAAEVTLNTFGESLGTMVSNPQILITALWVMTLGCIPPLIIIPLFLKKIQSGVVKIQKKDTKWGEIFMSAMFLGMISAFIGVVVAPKKDVVSGEMFVSAVPILTMLSSAVLMIVCGLIINKYKQEWLKNYAIPISMAGSMALAILFTTIGVR